MRPGEGKQSFRLHFLHDRLPFEMLVAGICNLATRDLTLNKWAIQFHTKPFAKFTVIRQRTPDPRNRCLKFNTLLDMVIHTPPPGCILAQTDTKSNPLVARLMWPGDGLTVTCGSCHLPNTRRNFLEPAVVELIAIFPTCQRHGHRPNSAVLSSISKEKRM